MTPEERLARRRFRQDIPPGTDPTRAVFEREDRLAREAAGETPDPPEESDYNPQPRNIAEVKQYVTDHPGERASILDKERDGLNRVTLVAWLEGDDD